MRDWMERRQSWIYLTVILAGLITGREWPEVGPRLEPWLWPLLGGLLYVTFTQVPLTRIGEGFRDRRFLAALLLGNFVVIPLVLGGLVALLPVAPAVRVGVLLVLLMPCTDWFIGFTYLGKGDAGRAVAATPVLLLMQLLALPAYLWLLLGTEGWQMASGHHLLVAFAGLILTPLALAWVTERLAEPRRHTRRWLRGLNMLPVPLLALVVFVIAASQVTTVAGVGGTLLTVLPIFVAYLLFAAALGKGLGRLFRLPPRSARTLTFSFGTRNSFVMLPIALTLPEAWQAVVVIIVFQSLVELFGMLAYLSWVPRWWIPESPGA